MTAEISASWYDSGPAGGPGAGGSTDPGLTLVAGTGPCWSAGVRQRADPLPGPRDRLGPRPVRGDLPAPAAPAAHQPGRRVQDAATQHLGLGLGQVAVEGEQLESGEQDLRHHRRGQPRLVELVIVGGEPADPGRFPGADRVLDPGVHAVAGVDVGVLPAPALRVCGEVGDPQLVVVAVLVLEQGQLGAGVGALAAGEDPHRLGPVLQLVPVRAFAQQPGELGDVRFPYPAAAVPAAGVRAGAVGAALADLAAVVNRDLPRLPGDQPDGGLLSGIQFPPARIHQRVSPAAGEGIQMLHQLVAETGTVHVTIRFRRHAGGSAAIDASAISM